MKKLKLDAKKVYVTLEEWKLDYLPKRVEIEKLTFSDFEYLPKLNLLHIDSNLIKERFV